MKKLTLFFLILSLLQSCFMKKSSLGSTGIYPDSVSIALNNGSETPPANKDTAINNNIPFGRNVTSADTPITYSDSKVQTASGRTTVAKTLTWLDFESGYAKAIKENKILMVDVYTDWCYWCKVMDRETFSDSAVIQKLNSNFVTVKLNPEKDKTFHFGDTTMNQVELYRWLGYGNTFGFPTTYFWISPAKSPERYSLAGYNEPAAFIDILAQITAKKK